MIARSSYAALALCLSLATLGASGCGRRLGSIDGPAGGASADSRGVAASTIAGRTGPTRPAGGMTCSGRDDCPADQVCVANMCRYRDTSVAGEILANSAAGQVEAGDWAGAIRTYDEAFEQFEAAGAHVPPDLLCASASLILSTAADADARERGARRADQCFRASLPGSPERAAVLRAVARLRFEGLDTALFDRAEPAERFFTQEPSRPTTDALEIDIQFPETDDAGSAQVREQLAGEGAHRAIGECFVQDWEMRHERSASASLIVRYATRLRDMGSYDVYEPTLTVDKTTVAEDGFEPCVARALADTLTAPRGGRVVAWQTTMEIRARLQ